MALTLASSSSSRVNRSSSDTWGAVRGEGSAMRGGRATAWAASGQSYCGSMCGSLQLLHAHDAACCSTGAPCTAALPQPLATPGALRLARQAVHVLPCAFTSLQHQATPCRARRPSPDGLEAPPQNPTHNISYTLNRDQINRGYVVDQQNPFPPRPTRPRPYSSCASPTVPCDLL